MAIPKILKVKAVSKFYKSITALENVDLSVNEGEILCILGPSGSGKSTLLRLIAGLEKPSHGDVFIKDQPQTGIPPQLRGIGFVFQTTEAVFSHMNVFNNIIFPLTLDIRKDEVKDKTKVANEMINLVRLAPYVKRYPEKLSGGEQQRIAIARALVYRPSILLLDEPLSSLDNILKKELMDIIIEIRKRFHPTILYVTHDEREALELSDKIAILDNGKILQFGSPEEVSYNPKSRKVADIIGGWNIIKTPCLSIGTKLNLRSEIFDFQLDYGKPIECNYIEIGIPASAIGISTNRYRQTKNGYVILNGIIERITPWYGEQRIHVKVGEFKINIEKRSFLENCKVGTKVYLKIEKSNMKIWQISN